MATYNWAFGPGIPNNYGIEIDASDEDERPNNAIYVSLFGNDITGNGSRQKPFRTLNKACSLGISAVNIIIGSGLYRERIGNYGIAYSRLIGDGDVTIDVSYFVENNFNDGGYAAGCYNLTIKGNGYTYLGVNQLNNDMYDCILEGAIWTNRLVSTVSKLKNVVVKNYKGKIFLGGSSLFIDNITFINCNNIVMSPYSSYTTVSSCIFERCNIQYISEAGENNLRYSLFNKCNFFFTPSETGNSGFLYPLVPDSYVYIDNIDELRSAFLTAFNIDYIPFKGCIIEDPKFNNPEIGDYSLAFDSPAKNTSYFGTYIGAKSMGYPIKARTTEDEGDFDFSTAVNVSVTDNSIMLINPEIDASIETKVIANLKGRELAEAPIFGFSADRNGQYIDSLADLSEITVSVGTSLKNLTPYIVEGASITVNGSIYQPGERFTTKDVLDFSSDGGGVCREILEAPQRHTIMARFSNGGASKSVGDPLVIGYWYYPISGTINYNGVEYFQKSFKAIDTNSFTTSDGGVLIEAFTNEEYQHYESGIAFSSNNVGNVRTGEILRGNGDPDYIRGNGFEFPINARFIQLKYIIRVNNLKP